MIQKRTGIISTLLFALSIGVSVGPAMSAEFTYDKQALPSAKPWTSGDAS
jgi:hypothetical protein